MHSDTGYTNEEKVHISFPKYIAGGVLFLTCVFLVWVAYYTLETGASFEKIKNHALLAKELRGNIIHLDEVLTMSARMAVLTGDLKWKERYDSFVDHLDNSIKQAIDLELVTYVESSAKKTDQANSLLVEMEVQAFELLITDKQQKAKNLLFSDTYTSQKKIYAEGMEQFTNMLNSKADQDINHEIKKSQYIFVVVISLLLFLLFLWFITVKNIQRWSVFLTEASNKAALASRLKSDFLATMSHEIRTPMNGIFGMAELVLETELTPKQTRHIKALMSSADALLTLIDDILDFSKIEAGKLELELLPFNLRILTEDVAELLSIRAQEKAVEVIVRYMPEAAEYAVGDSGRIRQVINNLVGNAIKFTEKGYVLITVEPWKTTTITEAQVGIKISVSDTGIGISQDLQDIIFNKFSQVDASTTRKYGGTGLGLAICKQLSTMMDGNVGVESTQGEGSTFWFTMILEKSEAIANEYDRVDTDISVLDGISILVVDDIEINRTLLNEQLNSIGMQCTFCASAGEALLLLREAKNKKKPFQMALIDYLMPGMNGETLAKSIKGDPEISDIALMMLSSAGNESYRNQLIEAGFSSHISKPVRIKNLFSILIQIWIAYSQGNKNIIIFEDDLSASKELRIDNKVIFQDTRILLAEDNRVNQAFAKEMLNNFGCKVNIANNGKEALTMIKNTSYDLILMDCQMPIMDGYEASGIIRDMRNKKEITDVPVIALTANAMHGDMGKCLEAGMDDYISKPVKKGKLKEKLTQWIPKEKIKDKWLFETSVAMGLDNEVLEEAQKIMKGGRFLTIIEYYLEDTAINIERIRTAIANDDAKATAALVRTIKSSSNQLGAVQVSNIANDMEVLAEKNITTIAEISTLLELLEMAFTDVQPGYQKILQENSA